MKLGVPADTNPNLEVLLVFLVVQGNVTPAWVFFDQANPPPPISCPLHLWREQNATSTVRTKITVKYTCENSVRSRS